MPMPLPEAEYVVIGLTNGPGFTANPCLAEQVAWVRERRLMAAAYAVASWPDDAAVEEHGETGPYDGGTELGALANTGYQQALDERRDHAPGRARHSPIVWVDVEPVPDFEWSGDTVGQRRGRRGRGPRVRRRRLRGRHLLHAAACGRGVVGDLALGLPEWRAAGQTSRQEALDRCGRDWPIQGGRAVLGQWVEQAARPEHHLPGRRRRPRPLVPAVLTRR